MSFLRPSQLHKSSRRHRLDPKGMGSQLLARRQRTDPNPTSAARPTSMPTATPTAVIDKAPQGITPLPTIGPPSTGGDGRNWLSTRPPKPHPQPSEVVRHQTYLAGEEARKQQAQQDLIAELASRGWHPNPPRPSGSGKGGSGGKGSRLQPPPPPPPPPQRLGSGKGAPPAPPPFFGREQLHNPRGMFIKPSGSGKGSR
jgi:hypothetical protein